MQNNENSLYDSLVNIDKNISTKRYEINKLNNEFDILLLQLAKKHSIKENIAKEYLEQIVEVFSKFKNKAKEIDVNEQTYHRIYNELRLNFK